MDILKVGPGGKFVNSSKDFHHTTVEIDDGVALTGDSGKTAISITGMGGAIAQKTSGDINLDFRSGDQPASAVFRDFRGQHISINATSGVGGIIIDSQNRPATAQHDEIKTGVNFVGSILINGALNSPNVSLRGPANSLTVTQIQNGGSIELSDGASMLVTRGVTSPVSLTLQSGTSAMLGLDTIHGPYTGVVMPFDISRKAPNN